MGKKSGQGHPEGKHHPGRMGDELPTADLARKGQGPLNGGDKVLRETETETN